MQRRCIICGRQEQVHYKRMTDSGRYYHICAICKSRMLGESKKKLEFKKFA